MSNSLPPDVPVLADWVVLGAIWVTWAIVHPTTTSVMDAVGQLRKGAVRLGKQR